MKKEIRSLIVIAVLWIFLKLFEYYLVMPLFLIPALWLLGFFVLFLIIFIYQIVRLIVERKNLKKIRIIKALFWGVIFYFTVNFKHAASIIEKADWHILYRKRMEIVEQVKNKESSSTYFIYTNDDENIRKYNSLIRKDASSNWKIKKLVQNKEGLKNVFRRCAAYPSKTLKNNHKMGLFNFKNSKKTDKNAEKLFAVSRSFQKARTNHKDGRYVSAEELYDFIAEFLSLPLEIHGFKYLKSKKVFRRTSETGCDDILILFVDHLHYHVNFIFDKRIDSLQKIITAVKFENGFNSGSNYKEHATLSVTYGK